MASRSFAATYYVQGIYGCFYKAELHLTTVFQNSKKIIPKLRMKEHLTASNSFKRKRNAL